MNSESHISNPETSLIEFVKFRYYPYWPLLLVLGILCGAAGFFYLKYTTPLYESSAYFIIKDEKKGTDDTKMLESLNIYTQKKIVEDEIQVLQSITLNKEVVRALHLYAPLFEEGYLRPVSAYTKSPVLVEVENFDQLFNENEKIFIDKAEFEFDSITRKVILNKVSYPLLTWLNTAHGRIRFIANPRYDHLPHKLLYFSLVNPKLVCNDLIKRLDISETSKLSSVVKMTLRDELAIRGEDILNELTRAYNEAGIHDKNQLAANTLAFVKNRLESVKKALDSIEMSVENYKTEHGIVDLSQQSETVLRNIGDNNQKVADASMQISVLNEVERYVRNRDNTIGIVPSTLGVNDIGLSQLLQKLYDAQINYEKMKKTVGENNPMVSSLSNEIDKIRPAILENIRIQQVSLKASLANLNSTNNQYLSQLQSLPEKERGLLMLTRQEAIMNTVYSFLLQKREETALSYASTVPDSRTVDTAVSTMDPVSPKKIIVLAMAGIAALFLWVGLLTIKDALNNKVLYRTDLQKLTTLPVLGEISYFARSPHILALHEPSHDFLKEEFRQLRAVMGLQNKNSLIKKILFTSGKAGEGKSFISTNMAMSIALAGKKVVLLDFDQSNPEITSLLGLQNELGLTDYLLGGREPYEIIKTSMYENLFICGYGRQQFSLTDYPSQHRLEELFEYLEETFDFIIIDAAPIDIYSDPYILSAYCDITNYLVRHNDTPKVLVRYMQETQRIRQMKNLKIIFNSVRSRGMLKEKFGIGYGYGFQKFPEKTGRLKRKQAAVGEI